MVVKGGVEPPLTGRVPSRPPYFDELSINSEGRRGGVVGDITSEQ